MRIVILPNWYCRAELRNVTLVTKISKVIYEDLLQLQGSRIFSSMHVVGWFRCVVWLFRFYPPLQYLHDSEWTVEAHLEDLGVFFSQCLQISSSPYCVHNMLCTHNDCSREGTYTLYTKRKFYEIDENSGLSCEEHTFYTVDCCELFIRFDDEDKLLLANPTTLTS